MPNARTYHPMMRLGEAAKPYPSVSSARKRVAWPSRRRSQTFVKHLSYAARWRALHWLELTEFAHCEPNALAFRALVALLDTWPGDDQTAAIAYADKLLPRGLMPFDLPHGLGARP